MPYTAPKLWNALIRTHHITSRKKVAKLKQAATLHSVFVLLRSGGSPGIMYVEGRGGVEEVEGWVGAVQNLRYKDYQLVQRPGVLVVEEGGRQLEEAAERSLVEIGEVRGFGEKMRERGVFEWWRRGMGWTGQEGRI